MRFVAVDVDRGSRGGFARARVTGKDSQVRLCHSNCSTTLTLAVQSLIRDLRDRQDILTPPGNTCGS